MTTETWRADEILRQLGGSRFRAMTGAKHFVALDDGSSEHDMACRLGGVSFRIGRNAKSINWVRIEVSFDDTYEVTFGRGLKNPRPVRTFDGIYCDGLRDLFERETGLYTSL